MATVMKNYVTHILYVCTVVFWVMLRSYQQSVSSKKILTLSDPMSDLVRHDDFPVPDAFLDL
jgi:hypothetical protein